MVSFIIPYLVLCANALTVTTTVRPDTVAATVSSSSSGLSRASSSSSGTSTSASSSSSTSSTITSSSSTSTIVSSSSTSTITSSSTSSTPAARVAAQTSATSTVSTSKSSITSSKSSTISTSKSSTSSKSSTVFSKSSTSTISSSSSSKTSSATSEATQAAFAPMLLAFSSSSSCEKQTKTVTFGYWKGTKTSAHQKDALKALDKYKKWLKLDENKNREAFKYLSGDIVGYMWVGSRIGNSDFADSDAFAVLYNEIKNNGIPTSAYIESVNSDPMKTFGIALNVGGSKKLGTVQAAAKNWSQGKKYDSNTGTKAYKGKTICMLSLDDRKSVKNDEQAGDCREFKVRSDQKPADTAGIGLLNLKGYNPSVDFDNLAVGQHLCKSIGTMPRYKPTKNDDGSCEYHTIVSGDNCWDIAHSFDGVAVSDIDKFNTKTFGYNGCAYLQIGQKICVSSGTPPRPTPDPDAECGPLAPGDLYNKECPLNACCSQYGYCGTTAEYCSTKKSATNNPGTTGCYSNCGYGKVHTDTRSDFENLAYWLDDDGDLKMDPSTLTNDYSILHYAFVTINSDLSLDTSKLAKSKFLNLNGVKKVVSIGGGEFSFGDDTASIFPQVIKSANRNAFATAVANLVSTYGLDGVDLDWEYPSTATEGSDYYQLIKLIKGKLASGKTLSVAIPASYYNLKTFPLTDIQNYVDYFVFMTYDLHGTWSPSSDPYMACHTDKTDVIAAIQMMDKAGVQMSKIYSGLANYGRSYQASSTSCLKLGCKYKNTGKMGNVLKTRGILLYSEIDNFISNGLKDSRYTNSTAMCDVMVYDKQNVVAWPKKSQVDAMRDFFHSSGLKGSALWAANYS